MAMCVSSQACVSAGFFYITNHGVNLDFLAEVFEQSKKFFALPLEEKMKVLHDKNQRGYTPFEEDMLNPGTQSRGKYPLPIEELYRTVAACCLLSPSWCLLWQVIRRKGTTWGFLCRRPMYLSMGRTIILLQVRVMRM